MYLESLWKAWKTYDELASFNWICVTEKQEKVYRCEKHMNAVNIVNMTILFSVSNKSWSHATKTAEGAAIQNEFKQLNEALSKIEQKPASRNYNALKVC